MNAFMVTESVEDRPEVAGITLEKTVKMMKLTFSRMLLLHPELDVTVDQWVVLQLLCKHGKLSQQELCDLAFKDAPTMTRMIDLLVSKELVLRSPDKKDRRKFNIYLTKQGKQKYDLIVPIVQTFRNEAYAGIEKKELIALETTLNKIFDNLAQQN